MEALCVKGSWAAEPTQQVEVLGIHVVEAESPKSSFDLYLHGRQALDNSLQKKFIF